MMDLFKWVLQRRERSKDAAHKRLRLILLMDRVGVSTEMMDAMKGTIVAGLSDYVIVDEDSVKVDIKRDGESMVLVSNVEIKEVVRNFATVPS